MNHKEVSSNNLLNTLLVASLLVLFPGLGFFLPKPGKAHYSVKDVLTI